MTGFGPRAVLVPDLGEDLARAIGELEELLLNLRAAEDGGAVLPSPLAHGAALAALRRLWRAVAPTQGRRAVRARLGGRLYAPGGRIEHVPLRLVDIDPVDVATLSAAAAALGTCARGDRPGDGTPGHTSEPGSDTVRDVLDAARKELSGAELVVVAAGVSGLLDLADTAESIVLRERLAAAGPGADVVLTPAQEAAYRATADRLDAMWPRPGRR
ncbi:hypothetical protein [Nonomuraea sp. NPDC003804]|uniref:hypothetical protein n=1 Tax=Nonomuraea sp. NPDC003804 TaxID=3154547 RepID=UPI0033BE91BF